MTYNWTQEQIHLAVGKCRNHHKAGHHKFSASLLSGHIPGQGRRPVSLSDRNELLFKAVYVIFSRFENVGVYITGRAEKSTFCIHLVENGALTQYFDSSLLCDQFLFRLLKSSIILSPYLETDQLEICMVNDYMWCEIFNLFYVYDRNGKITEKDLFSFWGNKGEGKDRKQLIINKANEFICLYKVLKLGWNLVDMSHGGLFETYNDLFLAIVNSTAQAFVLIELNPSRLPPNLSKKYKIMQQIEGYFEEDDKGNYSKEQRSNAVESWQPYRDDALIQTHGHAIVFDFELDSAITDPDPGLFHSMIIGTSGASIMVQQLME